MFFKHSWKAKALSSIVRTPRNPLFSARSPHGEAHKPTKSDAKSAQKHPKIDSRWHLRTDINLSLIWRPIIMILGCKVSSFGKDFGMVISSLAHGHFLKDAPSVFLIFGERKHTMSVPIEPDMDNVFIFCHERCLSAQKNHKNHPKSLPKPCVAPFPEL